MIDYNYELKELSQHPPYRLPDKSLQNTNIILYGAGELGHLAITLMRQTGIVPLYIVDKSEKKAGSLLDGILIKLPNEITEKEKLESIFLICVSTVPYKPIYDYLSDLGIRNIVQFYTYAYFKFPELLSNGYIYDINTNFENVKKICSILTHDENSLAHYLTFLWWKHANIEKIYNNFEILSGKKYFNAPSTRMPNKNEVFVDLGTHFGQTIEKFTHWTNNQYDKILAFEPDEYNLSICKEKFTDKRIQYFKEAVSDFCGSCHFKDGLGYASKIDEQANKEIRCVTIDSLNITPTIIKLHIEGKELKALKGMVETIKKSKPLIMCLADHSDDGVCNIPLFLAQYGYKLHFYLHDYCGNSAIWYASL